MLIAATDLDGVVLHGRRAAWPLPVDDRPAAWFDGGGEGVRLARGSDVVRMVGPALFEAEADGVEVADGFVVARRARLVRRLGGWNAAAARTFAVGCAERVVELIGEEHRDTAAAVLTAAGRERDLGAARDDARAVLEDVMTRFPGPSAWSMTAPSARDASGAAVWDGTFHGARGGCVDAFDAWNLATTSAISAAWSHEVDAAWAVLAAAASPFVAARDAARDAARAAAWSAVPTASSSAAEQMATSEGVSASSWASIRSDARAIAFDAERRWQFERLAAAAGIMAAPG